MRYPDLKKVWVFTLLTLLPFSSFSQPTVIDVAVGLSKPPYVIQASDSGFELELIQHIFNNMGFDSKFYYTQFGHSAKMLDVDEIDAVMTTNEQVFQDKAQLSDIYITYQNVAISHKRDNLTINSVKDIGQYTIASFQKSEKVLGADFLDVVADSPLFLKIAKQEQQIDLLLNRRVEVLVMDINIFKYFARQQGLKNIEENFIFHEVFPDTTYRIAFKDKNKISSFNQSLAEFLKSDDYSALRMKYGF